MEEEDVDPSQKAGRIICSPGINAERNLVAFHNTKRVPKIWDGNLANLFAQFVLEKIRRGVYWIEKGKHLKLKISQAAEGQLVGLVLKNRLLVHHPRALSFIQYDFVPWDNICK